jgi:hypothetical protein
VRACTERHILTLEGSQLAIAQPRLNREKKQRSIPVADPCSRIGGRPRELRGARQLGSPFVLPQERMLPDGLLSF